MLKLIHYFLILGFALNGSAWQSKPSADISADIFTYTNLFRESKQLPPLKRHSFFDELAEKHSRNMANKKTQFGHDHFEDRNREASKKIKGLSAFAENVAYGQLTGAEVVELWKNSSGHRKNILGNFTMIGIGVATAADGTIFYTQIFAK